MSDFRVEPIAKMPPRRPHPSQSNSLATAVRALKTNEALFVAAQLGESADHAMRRIAPNIYRLKVGAHIRMDAEGNGVWIYKTEETD